MWRGQKGGVQAQNITKYECGGSAPRGARPEGKKQRPGGDGRRLKKRRPIAAATPEARDREGLIQT